MRLPSIATISVSPIAATALVLTLFSCLRIVAIGGGCRIIAVGRGCFLRRRCSAPVEFQGASWFIFAIGCFLMFGIGCRVNGWLDSLIDNICFFFLHAVVPMALGNGDLVAR